MAMLTAKGIHKRFGAAEVLRGVSLSMEKGEVVAIIRARPARVRAHFCVA